MLQKFLKFRIDLALLLEKLKIASDVREFAFGDLIDQGVDKLSGGHLAGGLLLALLAWLDNW